MVRSFSFTLCWFIPFLPKISPASVVSTAVAARWNHASTVTFISWSVLIFGGVRTSLSGNVGLEIWPQAAFLRCCVCICVETQLFH